MAELLVKRMDGWCSFLIGYLCLTVAHPSPLERMADTTDAGYIPLPDWYFLFLYQLLKYSYASGSFTVIGAFIMPGIAFGALLLAPFLDRGRKTSIEASCGNWIYAFSNCIDYLLTWESVAHHDWEAAKNKEQL